MPNQHIPSQQAVSSRISIESLRQMDYWAAVLGIDRSSFIKEAIEGKIAQLKHDTTPEIRETLDAALRTIANWRLAQ